MKKIIIFCMLMLLIPVVSATTNLDFRLDVEEKGFYPNEKVPLNVTIVNRDITFAAGDALLTVNIGDRFYTFGLGDLEPGEVFQKEIILPEFPAGTHNIKGEINYTGILDERFVEVSYGSFEVLFPPIERYPRNVYVSGYDLPEKIISGKSYDVSITITNDGEISADLLIEFGSINEFFTEKTILNPGKSTTVKMVVRFGTPGVSLIEARAYALIKGEKYLLNYRGRKTYVQAERKAKLIFDRIEFVGEWDNEINQEDTVKFKVFIKNEGDTATDVKGELSSNIEKINVLDSTVSYVTIASRDNVAPLDDVFEIETKGVDIGDYELNLKLSYVDSENREKEIQIPITISEGGDSCTKDADCLDTQTCKNNQCVEILCECGYIKNRKCVYYQCCSDEQCEEDLMCNQKLHVCEVPTELKRDVLIVTIGNKLGTSDEFKTSLNNYRKILENEGLTSYYIELDSERVKKFFNVQLANSENWRDIKSVLDKIISKIEPQYAIILGGVDVIPMPLAKTDSEIPKIPVSDDRYSDLDFDGIPDIVIARIPINSPDRLANYLKMLISEHTNPQSIKKLIVADACGGSNCFLKKDIDYLSPIFLKEECDNSQNCLLSPPYCSGVGVPGLTPLPCGKKKELFENIKSSNFIFFGAHGDGKGFYAVESMLIGDTILTGRKISEMNFNNKKIMTFACFGGTIDITFIGLFPTEEGVVALYPKANPSTSTALTSINSGASVYLGNTRFGYGYHSVRFISDFYKNLEAGNSVGEAFLNMKKENLKKSYSDWKNAVIYEIQLYGDPTLKVNMG